MSTPAPAARSPALGALCVMLSACVDPAGPAAPEDARAAPPAARLVAADRAIHTAEIATIDPATLQDAEIDKVIGAGADCRFSYTRAGGPVLAAAATAGGRGVMKLNGALIELRVETAPRSEDDALALVADGVRATVAPLPRVGARRGRFRRANAEMRFELDEGLTAGYHGFYACSG